MKRALQEADGHIEPLPCCHGPILAPIPQLDRRSNAVRSHLQLTLYRSSVFPRPHARPNPLIANPPPQLNAAIYGERGIARQREASKNAQSATPSQTSPHDVSISLTTLLTSAFPAPDEWAFIARTRRSTLMAKTQFPSMNSVDGIRDSISLSGTESTSSPPFLRRTAANLQLQGPYENL